MQTGRVAAAMAGLGWPGHVAAAFPRCVVGFSSSSSSHLVQGSLLVLKLFAFHFSLWKLKDRDSSTLVMLCFGRVEMQGAGSRHQEVECVYVC